MSHARPANAHVIALLLLSSSAVAACAKAEQKSGLPKDDIVVAKVNGSIVTRYEVDQIANHSLGNLVVAAGQDSYVKVRDAAVRSRAIALAAEAELSAVDKQSLAKEVAAYREQLLVRRYLSRHAPPSSVTPDMARSYYQEHPERFGAKIQRSYELLGSSRAMAPAERDKLLNGLKGVENQVDWEAVVAKLKRSNLPVTLTLTNSSDTLLDQNLRELLRQLKPGQASPVTFVQGRVYVARVKGEDRQPPRPFEEVSAEIERLLAPSQLSQALESISKQVLSDTKVELLEPAASKSGGKP
jgi:PPIC-type PPIASE domain